MFQKEECKNLGILKLISMTSCVQSQELEFLISLHHYLHVFWQFKRLSTNHILAIIKPTRTAAAYQYTVKVKAFDLITKRSYGLNGESIRHHVNNGG